MATNTGVVNLDDQEHPLLDLTNTNYGTYFFRKLPTEDLHLLKLRLRIYEYAVYEDYIIEPIQVEPRSNKFHCEYQTVSEIRDCFDYVKRRTGPTVVPLSYTCRAIYAELQYFCPFYKVNTFLFRSASGIHKYLAAITPQRRRNIWWIQINPSLTDRPNPRWSFDQICPSVREKKRNDQILALLSQCSGVQKHRLRVDLYLRPLWRAEYAIDVLQRCLAWARDPLAIKDATTGHSFWSLPFFRLRIYTCGPIFCPIQNKLISDIDDALLAYRRRIGGGPQWFLDMATDSSLQDSAMELADIHFTGEERVAADKAGSLRGPPSSRTRQKCKEPEKNIGAPVRVVPKYSKEGILTVDEASITIQKIHWAEPDARCMVRWARCPPKTTWEDLSVFLAPQWRGNLARFYMNTMGSITLQEMRDTPSPSDIMKIAGADTLGFDTDVRGDRSFTAEWKRITNRWETRRFKLESLARLGRRERLSVSLAQLEAMLGGPDGHYDRQSVSQLRINLTDRLTLLNRLLIFLNFPCITPILFLAVLL
ncbi:hypothetical protein K449DRAFT_424368 [Hypoxylon sp. EC38]|nr:hypothetical protein K449DRAFT_424368 [Hypoxylon sp. EC38]